MTITEARDGDGHQAWDVLSPSGKTYHVRYEGCGDGEDVRLWSCNCPASKYHPETMCKHIIATINVVDEVEDCYVE